MTTPSLPSSPVPLLPRGERSAGARRCLALLAVLLASVLATAGARAAVPAEIHLTVEGADAAEAERLRRAIASEASTRVVLDGGGPARVRVRRGPRQVEVLVEGPEGRRLVRTLPLPPEPQRAREAIVLLVGNLVRDEAADLEASLRPPAPPASASASAAALVPAPVPAGAPGQGSTAGSTAPGGLEAELEAELKADPDVAAAASKEGPGLGDPLAALDRAAREEVPPGCETPGTFYPAAAEAVPGVVAPPGAARDDSGRGLSLALIGGYGGSVEGVSLAALGEHGRRRVCGVQAAGLWALSASVRGAQLSGLVGWASGVRGAQFATVAGAGSMRGWQAGVVTVAGEMRGLQAGVVTVARHARGAQLSTLSLAETMHGAQLGVTLFAGEMRGAQLGVVSAAGSMHGVQMGVATLAAGEMRGLQLGTANVAFQARGAQVGVVNVAGRSEGAQVGLVNVADESDTPVGLVNVIRKGRTHVDVAALDYPGVAASLVHGGRHTHAIHGVGVRWTRSGEARPVAMLGLGAYWHFSESVFGEVDALYHFLPGAGFERNATASQLRLIAGLHLTPRVGIYVGPTLSVAANQLSSDEEFAPRGGWVLTRSDQTPTVVRMWPGLTAGVRLFLGGVSGRTPLPPRTECGGTESDVTGTWGLGAGGRGLGAGGRGAGIGGRCPRGWCRASNGGVQGIGLRPSVRTASGEPRVPVTSDSVPPHSVRGGRGGRPETPRCEFPGGLGGGRVGRCQSRGPMEGAQPPENQAQEARGGERFGGTLEGDTRRPISGRPAVSLTILLACRAVPSGDLDEDREHDACSPPDYSLWPRQPVRPGLRGW